MAIEAAGEEQDSKENRRCAGIYGTARCTHGGGVWRLVRRLPGLGLFGMERKAGDALALDIVLPLVLAAP
jgi:hypothetical protein